MWEGFALRNTFCPNGSKSLVCLSGRPYQYPESVVVNQGWEMIRVVYDLPCLVLQRVPFQTGLALGS